ncbi:MAG: PIN domain-containing protein [Synergistaceae bacterium]|nr:PIN domain-containing protein [Synergistaceae bacterium]
MIVLVDDNVLLDVLQERQPHYNYSNNVWDFCANGHNIIGYISALTIADIVYIMRKEITYDKIDVLLARVSKVFRVADLTLQDLTTAANMKWRDFEDAVQSAIASRINANYIITRNVKDFQGSKVQAVTPEDYFTNIFVI